MQEKIEKLYEQLQSISDDLLKYQVRGNLAEIKKIIPQMQEFAMWFLETNKFGIEEELYQDMSKNLVKILEDIVSALEQEDRVLLYDAVEYGMMEYLALFCRAE
jgi:hypothetical protein